MKKIGVIGTRKRNIRTDYQLTSDAFFDIYEDGDWIVSGRCKKGADAFAEKISEDYGIPILLFPPKKCSDRNEHIKSLFDRNKLIAKYSTVIIACLMNPHESVDDILRRQSGGTEHTLRHFRKYHPEGEIIVV